ncbi:MAG: DUF655 domain-containing protein [Methanimicrococcus sp.]|nr:DUF655 domain-containing protein [Methanimicrococcus sp.]
MTDEIPSRGGTDPTFEHRRHGGDRKHEAGGREDREEWVWVLDYLPYGRETDNRPVYQKKPLIHALGDNKLILLELIPVENKIPPAHIKTHIGAQGEEYAERVKSRISYDELSNGAKSELSPVLEDYVKINEERFINFFNEAKPLSMRQNSLELLPGIGKKLMMDVLDEKRKRPFVNFADLKERVHGLHNPEKLLVQRIIEEMKGGQKYYLFAAPPSRALLGVDGHGQQHGGQQHGGQQHGGQQHGHGQQHGGGRGDGRGDGRGGGNRGDRRDDGHRNDRRDDGNRNDRRDDGNRNDRRGDGNRNDRRDGGNRNDGERRY